MRQNMETLTLNVRVDANDKKYFAPKQAEKKHYKENDRRIYRNINCSNKYGNESCK